MPQRRHSHGRMSVFGAILIVTLALALAGPAAALAGEDGTASARASATSSESPSGDAEGAPKADDARSQEGGSGAQPSDAGQPAARPGAGSGAGDPGGGASEAGETARRRSGAGEAAKQRLDGLGDGIRREARSRTRAIGDRVRRQVDETLRGTRSQSERKRESAHGEAPEPPSGTAPDAPSDKAAESARGAASGSAREDEIRVSVAATDDQIRLLPGRYHFRVGRRVLVQGIDPAHLAGRRMVLEVRQGGRWVTVATARTVEDGRFDLVWHPRKPGRYRTRVRRARSGSVEPSAVRRLYVYRTAVASWYGPGFYGRRTACGQTFTSRLLGVAHRTLPCGYLVTIRYKGRSRTVPVVDRGPYASGRDYDLTEALRNDLGFDGVGEVLATA